MNDRNDCLFPVFSTPVEAIFAAFHGWETFVKNMSAKVAQNHETKE